MSHNQLTGAASYRRRYALSYLPFWKILAAGSLCKVRAAAKAQRLSRGKTQDVVLSLPESKNTAVYPMQRIERGLRRVSMSIAIEAAPENSERIES